MIEFRDVTKSYPSRSGRKIVLDSIVATFPPGKNTAVMGRNGAGKSTLLRLFSGAELPDGGQIVRNANVSWPLGFTGGLHGSLSGRENVAFLARIYNRDFREVFDYVEQFAEIGPAIEEPVKTYSNGMRARIAFGMSMAISFDYYLIDEVIAVGDPAFRNNCKQVLNDRLSEATVIMVSHSVSAMKEFCNHGAVLVDGHYYEFADMDDAVAVYQCNARP